jgi:spore coat polysaccharide biosynthesis predicted glycosyltransferase SpsG
MSECNMTLRGADKRDKLAKKQLSAVGAAYEPYFLEEVDPAIPWLAKNKTKICVNAGASDVEGLANEVKKLVAKHGVDLKVAYVDGDDCTDAALELYRKGENFPNLPAGKNIQDWPFEPLCAQCYLGATGIATCFAGKALPFASVDVC